MKKNKSWLKTLATSAFACVCTAAMVTGILAATSHTVNITTSVSFTATGVSGTFNGYTKVGASGTPENYYYTSGDNHAFAFNNSTTFTDAWTIPAIALTTTDEGAAVATNIVMEFTTSGSNNMAVGITGLGCLCGVTNLDATYTITDAASGYSVTTAQALVPQLYFEVGTGTTVLTISLSAHDTSVNISTVTVSGVSVNLASTTDTNWKTVTFAAGTDASGTMDAIKAWSGTTVVIPTSTFTAPTGKVFDKWNDGTNDVAVGSTITISSNIILTAQWETECFAEGTLITMADGTTKEIENIAEGDIVKTFDHETGLISNEEVYFVFEGGTKDYSFTLNFTSRKTLDIVGCHDLFEQSLLKYVTISSGNAEDYIGKYFYNANESKWEQLLSVTYNTEKCNYYSIYTAHHLNCIANDMLTVADDVDYLLNIFEFDNNLMINQSQKQADIEQYGLYDYSQASKYMTEEYFDKFNVKYHNIIIGKGFKTHEEMLQLFLDTKEYMN